MPATLSTKDRPACPICGAAGARAYEGMRDWFKATANTWSFARCSNHACGHFWLDPQPRDEELHLAYEDYPAHRPETKQSIPLAIKLYRGLARATGLEKARHRVIDYGLGPGNGAALLELGCGNGGRLQRLRTKGWRVEGQDIAPSAIRAARERLGPAVPLHLGDLDALPLRRGTYKAVVMNHVLEHVDDPVRFLRRARDLMADDGILVCVHPNADSGHRRSFGRDWLGFDPPRHLHAFTRASTLAAFAKAGLQVQRIQGIVVGAEWWHQGHRQYAALNRGDPPPGPWDLRLAAASAQLRALLLAPMPKRFDGDEMLVRASRAAKQA